jgi:hypothetical protein
MADALIHKHGSDYRVNSPAHVNGQAKQAFEIINTTDETAYVMLSPKLTGGNKGPVPVGAHATGSIPLARRVKGTYFYAVVVETDGGNVTAQADSDPVIIIDPPTP